MIDNERQYQLARAAARDFEAALNRLDAVEAHRAPEMRALMRAAMESQLEALQQQLAEYEKPG